MSNLATSGVQSVLAIVSFCFFAGIGCHHSENRAWRPSDGQAKSICTETVGSFAIDGKTYRVFLDRGLGSIADSCLRILDDSQRGITAIYWDDRFERLPVQIVGEGLESRIALGPGGSFSLARIIKGTSANRQAVWLLDIQGEEDCIAFAVKRAEDILVAYRQDGSQSLSKTLNDVSDRSIERLPPNILRSTIGPVYQVWLGEANRPAPSFIKYWECAVPVTVWDGDGKAHKFDLNFRGFDFDGSPGNLYQVWTGDRLPAFEVAMRTRMLQASRRQDPDFPDGERKKLTQFAYIGDVDANGKTLHVVAARSVIPKMLAPRGQAWLAFYDANENFVGAHPIDVFSPPLWCEGSRIYFFGVQSNGEQLGNTLDLSRGFANRRYVQDPAAGSRMPASAGQAAAGD